MVKTIVVVGGSSAGLGAAQTLAKTIEKKKLQANIVLVEKRTHFFYKIGSLRAAADKKYSEKVFIEYSKVFSGVKPGHGHKVVCDTVESVDKKTVTLKSGEKIDYDYLVLATGSVNQGPAGIAAATKEEGLSELSWYRENLERAKNILIVGGGAVAIEFVGEINEVFGSDPDNKKNITLVHSGQKLLGDEWKVGLRDRLLVTLKKFGTTVILNDRVELTEEQMQSTGKFSPTTVTTRAGKSIETDVLFMLVGNTVHTEYLQPLKDELGADNVVDSKTSMIKINEFLQLSADGCSHIFAAGDVNNLPSNEKLGFRAERMGVVAAENIFKLMESETTKKPATLTKYSIPISAIMVPIGPKDGAMQIFGFVIGAWLTSFLKGGDLFVKKATKTLNQVPS